jgi:tetratricopeptide (TPR) repeat protein
LTGYFTGEESAEKNRLLYCESVYLKQYDGNTLLGVVNEKWKYIQTTRPELYDLGIDPHETKNLFSENPKRARLLKNHLELILQSQARTNLSDSTFALDEESRKRLESLGYIGGNSTGGDFQFDSNKADPKDLIHSHEQKMTLQLLITRKQYERAKSFGEEILGKTPQDWFALYKMGEITFNLGQINSFIDYYSNVLAHEAHQTGKIDKHIIFNIHDKLTVGFLKIKKYDLAKEHAIAALALKSDQAPLHNNLGNALSELGEFDEAVKHYKRALELSTDSNTTLTTNRNLAKTFSRQGLRINPNQPDIQNLSGKIFYEDEKLEQAVYHWNMALQLRPDWPDVLNNLAWVKAEYENEDFYNPDEAVKQAQRACELTEFKRPDFVDTLAGAYAAAGKFPEAVKTAQKALDLARLENQQQLADSIKDRLERYKRGRP